MKENKIVRNISAYAYQSNGATLSHLKFIMRKLREKRFYPISLAVSVQDGLAYIQGFGFSYRGMPKSLYKTFPGARRLYKNKAGKVIKVPKFEVNK